VTPVDIVDAHHHLWDLKHGRYPWLQGPPVTLTIGDYADLRRDYLVEDLKADIAGHGVVASVHVQADWDEHGDPVAETAWLQGVADAHGFPQAIVAYADLAAPDAQRTLERHCAHRNMRGIRMLRPGPSSPELSGAAAMFDDARWRSGFARLEPLQLSFDMRVTTPEMPAAVRLARDFPQTTIIVNHLAFAPGRDPALTTAWRDGVAALATCPNVAMKVSGFAIVDRAWTVETIRPWVAFVIERFGPARCLFGSNYPVDRLGADYARIVAATRALIAGLPPAAQAEVLAGTARRLYRL
jgi:predicted TIM-barrel fold metal-dependent hydrolase